MALPPLPGADHVTHTWLFPATALIPVGAEGTVARDPGAVAAGDPGMVAVVPLPVPPLSEAPPPELPDPTTVEPVASPPNAPPPGPDPPVPDAPPPDDCPMSLPVLP